MPLTAAAILGEHSDMPGDADCAAAELLALSRAVDALEGSFE